MGDLSAVISGALTDAGVEFGGSDVDLGASDTSIEVVADGTGTTDGVVEADAAVKPDAPAKKEPVVDEDDLTAEEYAELGLLPPKEGERYERIPQPRVKKMLGKALKKQKAAHTAAMAETTAKMADYERKAQAQSEMDTLIATDDRRFLHFLAGMHPDKYDKYLTPAEKKEIKAEAKADAVDDPMPAADVKNTDGTTGYSTEQWEKYTQWQARGIQKSVRAELDKEYAAKWKGVEPLVKGHEARQAQEAFAAQELPKIKADVDAATETWGELFTEEYKKGDQSDIIKYLTAHPKVSFAAGVAAVLRPKLSTNRTDIRKEVIEDLKKRPAAASGSSQAQAKVVETERPKTTADIVRAELTKAGLLKR